MFVILIGFFFLFVRVFGEYGLVVFIVGNMLMKIEIMLFIIMIKFE